MHTLTHDGAAPEQIKSDLRRRFSIRAQRRNDATGRERGYSPCPMPFT
jgi:hypothetical protein